MLVFTGLPVRGKFSDSNENPGEIFTVLQFPNEEPDLGYFDHETKRLERIKNERIGNGINSS